MNPIANRPVHAHTDSIRFLSLGLCEVQKRGSVCSGAGSGEFTDDLAVVNPAAPQHVGSLCFLSLGLREVSIRNRQLESVSAHSRARCSEMAVKQVLRRRKELHCIFYSHTVINVR